MTRPKLGLVVVAAMLLLSLAVFGMLPPEIPRHWNLEGEVDAWSPRWLGAFMGPALALGIWLLLRFLPRIDPRREHYGRFWDTYWIVANMVILVMAVLHVFVLGAALGLPLDMARLVLLVLGLLFLGIGNYLPRVRSNWWFGIRTPWTLESERVWRETHRLAGRTFMLGGVITLVAALLPEAVRPWAAMAGIGVAGFIPVVYSFLAWRREQRERTA